MASNDPTTPPRGRLASSGRTIGWLLGAVALWAAAATSITFAAPADQVDEAEPQQEAAPEVAPARFHCKVFPTPLDAAVDTRDHSSDLGRWVMDLEARGWAVHGVDFEVGQKPTGFAEGFVQVCMTPVVRQP